MKRLALAFAVVALTLALAAPAVAYITPPGAADIIAPYCRTGTTSVPTVPAGEPLTLWFAWVSKNRGLDEAWIHGMTLELTIDGIPYPNLGSYYQPPGDFHWPTSNPLLEELWAVPWVFPLDPLAAGESLTYTLNMTADHL